MTTSSHRLTSYSLLGLLFSVAVAAQDRGNHAAPSGRDQGLSMARQSRCQEAYSILVPWLNGHPDDAEVRLAAVRCGAEIGRTWEAAELLMALDESEPEVQLLWGRLLIDKRDAEGAVATLEPLMVDPPAALEPEIRRLLAWAYLGAGEPERAVNLLDGKVADNPRMAVMLARARYESGQQQAALQVLEPFADTALGDLSAAADTSPATSSLEVVYEFGRLLVANARHAEAIPFLEAAIGRSPGCKPCWQQLARGYAAVGRSEDARAAQQRYESIIAAEPPAAERDRRQATAQRDPTAVVLREATQLFKSGAADEALAMLQRESRLRPGDPRLLLLAARFLLDLGRRQEALTFADYGIELAPEGADGYFVRGTILMAMGDTAGAERDLRRVLELESGHIGATKGLERLREP